MSKFLMIQSVTYHMELDSLFRQQSERDLKSAYFLYDMGDYGNAVFLSQQAIEKAFKYVMMKYELISKDTQSLKTANHKPVTELLKKLELYNNKFEPKNDAEKTIKDANEQFMPHLKNIFEEMSKSKISDDVWWKISLGIKLPVDDEEKIFQYIKKCLDNVLEILQVIKNKIIEINKKINNPLINEMDRVHYNLKKYRDALADSSEHDVPKFLKITQQEVSDLQNLSTYLRKAKQTNKETIGMVTLGIWVITYDVTLLKITAHEQRGRYPEKINCKNSFFIYKKNLDHLKTLMDDAKKATTALYSL